MIPAIPAKRRFGQSIAIACLLALSAGCFSLDVDTNRVSLLQGLNAGDLNIEAGSTTGLDLVVRAFDTNVQPMEGVEVHWSLSSSSAGTLSATSTTTDGSGLTQVTFKPGNTPGGVSVRASADGVSVSFAITIVAASG